MTKPNHYVVFPTDDGDVEVLDRSMDLPECFAKCRDCTYWHPIPPWQGNCKLHPTTRPQWSADACPLMRGCPSFLRRVQPGIYRNGKLVKTL